MVTCGGLDCSVCSLLELIQNIFNWLLGISAALAVLLVILAGFTYLMSLSDDNLFIKAKRFLIYAVAGFLLILVSFLIFNTVYLALGSNNKKSWFKIDCSQDQTGGRESQENFAGNEGSRESRINLSIANSNGVQISISDTQKVTELNLSNLSPENLLLDLINLEPGQELNFIISDKSQDASSIIDCINTSQGFSGSQERGDRMADDSLKKNVLTVKKDDQGTITADDGAQEITADTSNKKDMGDFRNYLEDFTEQLKNSNEKVYVYNTAKQEDYSAGSQESCEISGGIWTVYLNECAARKAVCGKESIRCSKTPNETDGCQCPEESCLQYGKCVARSKNAGDTDRDGVADNSDHCPDTPSAEKVDSVATSSNQGCSCSQIPLESRKCPASRCEGTNLVTYSDSAQDNCLNGKIIKNSCIPLRAESSQQCQTTQDTNGWAVNNNRNANNYTQQWLNDLKNALNGNPIGPRPNDSMNNWEKQGNDEGGASAPTSSRPSSSSQNTGQTDTSSSPAQQPVQQGTDTQPPPSPAGGSEASRALAQKLVRIPEGILANNSGVTPYVINECIPKLNQAAVNLDKIRPGWKIYPSSIYRSDEKQTAMWDRSSKNEAMIARPKARGGRGSQHSSGNALDLRFVDANGRKVSMDSNNKALLRQVLTDAGMLPYNAEWWHFYCIKPFRF